MDVTAVLVQGWYVMPDKNARDWLSASKFLAPGFALLLSACIFGVSSNGEHGDAGDTAAISDGGLDTNEHSDDGTQTTREDASNDATDVDEGEEDGEECESSTWYADDDGDGFGDPDATEEACERPEDYVDNSDDCDDGDDDIHPDAEEACDGVDQNCNGTPDEEEPESTIVAEKCDAQKGVCEGARISTCTSDGSSYETCGPDVFEAHSDDYRKPDDENWRCDGTDNDCDGDPNEACCEPGAQPTPTEIDPDDTDQTAPAMAPAIQGAPANSAFAVAWLQGTTLRVRHVDKQGEAAGSSEVSMDLSAELSSIDSAHGLDITSHPGGYVVAVAARRNSSLGDDLMLYRYDSQLASLSPAKTDIDSTGNGESIGSPSLAQQGNQIWVAYSAENVNGHIVKAAAVNATDGSLATGDTRLSGPDATDAMSTGTLPEIAVASGTPTVAWWDVDGERIDGARIVGGSPQDRFHVDLTKVPLGAEKIDLFSANGDLGILYPTYGAGGNAELKLLTFGPNDTGSLTGATPLTGAGVANNRPSALPVDPNGDGTDESLLVLWEKSPTGSSQTEIAVGSTQLSSPSQLPEKTVMNEFTRLRDLGVRNERAAGLSLDLVDQTNKDVTYTPISIDGVPVCNPDP